MTRCSIRWQRDALDAAISLNELAECLVGAKNLLAQHLHFHNARGRVGRESSDAATLVTERLDLTFQALKRDTPVLLSALQRELPSTPFLDLPLLTRERLKQLNTTLAKFEKELASRAIGEFARVNSAVSATLHFTVLFNGNTGEEGTAPFGERSLRFRLPGALRRDNANYTGTAIQFRGWADRQRWLDLSQNPPIGFEPCQLTRVLYEHGALGWKQLALARELRVSFDRSSTEHLSVTL